MRNLITNWRRFLFRLFSVGIFFCAIISCSVQNEISRDDYKPISKTFRGKFYDNLDTVTGPRDRSFVKDLIGFTSIDFSKPIEIAIEKDAIYFTVIDLTNQIKVAKIHGKKYRHKFVFYTSYRTITFPMLYMIKDSDRFSVRISGNDEIVFRNKSTNEGAILFFGAGNSSQKEHQFKLLKNE